jgi:hypothetical protein
MRRARGVMRPVAILPSPLVINLGVAGCGWTGSVTTSQHGQEVQAHGDCATREARGRGGGIRGFVVRQHVVVAWYIIYGMCRHQSSTWKRPLPFTHHHPTYFCPHLTASAPRPTRRPRQGGQLSSHRPRPIQSPTRGPYPPRPTNTPPTTTTAPRRVLGVAPQ